MPTCALLDDTWPYSHIALQSATDQGKLTLWLTVSLGTMKFKVLCYLLVCGTMVLVSADFSNYSICICLCNYILLFTKKALLQVINENLYNSFFSLQHVRVRV